MRSRLYFFGSIILKPKKKVPNQILTQRLFEVGVVGIGTGRVPLIHQQRRSNAMLIFVPSTW
jgi:hypothetical protein